MICCEGQVVNLVGCMEDLGPLWGMEVELGHVWGLALVMLGMCVCVCSYLGTKTLIVCLFACFVLVYYNRLLFIFVNVIFLIGSVFCLFCIYFFYYLTIII